MGLAFVATKACYWTMFNFLSQRTIITSFLQVCFLSSLPPAHTAAWRFSIKDAEPKFVFELFLPSHSSGLSASTEQQPHAPVLHSRVLTPPHPSTYAEFFCHSQISLFFLSLIKTIWSSINLGRILLFDCQLFVCVCVCAVVTCFKTDSPANYLPAL